MSNYTMKIQSASRSLVARYAILCALKVLVDLGIISKGYLTKYRNKNISRKSALAYVRKYANFAVKPVATNGSVVRYKVYLQVRPLEELVIEDLSRYAAPQVVEAIEADKCLNLPLPSNAAELDAKEDADKRAINANTRSYFSKPGVNPLLDEEARLQREEDGDAYHEELVAEQLERIALNI